MSKTMKDDVYKIIENDWPVNETDIAKKLGLKVDEKNQRQSVARVDYHIRILKGQEKIRTKKVGGSLVIWPHEIEKIRFIHEMMRVK